MNIYDILIGVIIGIGLERALKVSEAAQRAIKKAKENRKKKLEAAKNGESKQQTP